MNTRTLTANFDKLGTLMQIERADHLTVLFRRDDLTVQPSRHLLTHIDVVEIGRGDGPRAERIRRDGRGVLLLRLDDPRISSNHVRLERTRGHWVIADQKSRNGTFLDGEPVERQTLTDGTAFEVGSYFLGFREGLAIGSGVEPDTYPDGLGDVYAEWKTFHTPLAAAYADLAAAAKAGLSVLVLGETGTGKERVAEGVHHLSEAKGPFVAVNCATLESNLADSALFGHKRGAFTGANDDRPGFIRRSASGTLFLDEIAELPAAVQSRLLRVLETKEIIPVGADRGQIVDFRLVAATHNTLAARIDAGDFRSDLHARLAQMTIELPPLAGRIEDLGILINDILDDTSLQLDRAAAWALVRCTWPQNIRQLVNALNRAKALCDDGIITIRHLPPEVLEAPPRDTASPQPMSLNDEEQDRLARLTAALRETQGNVSKTAELLGLSRNSTHRWLKRFQVDPEQYR